MCVYSGARYEEYLVFVLFSRLRYLPDIEVFRVKFQKFERFIKITKFAKFQLMNGSLTKFYKKTSPLRFSCACPANVDIFWPQLILPLLRFLFRLTESDWIQVLEYLFLYKENCSKFYLKYFSLHKHKYRVRKISISKDL